LRVIVDTNVILGLLLGREPFVQGAAQVFALAERSEIEGLLCATTVTTIDYLLGQSLARTEARRALHRLMGIFEIAAVNRAVIEEALRSRIPDFEDAVVEESGRHAGAEAVVTRDTKHFRRGRLKALDPAEFLAGF
jgi:predicted nucleic acid-binding protein